MAHETKKIAIIGAGAGGLISAHIFRQYAAALARVANSDSLTNAAGSTTTTSVNIVIYERAPALGGVWRFQPLPADFDPAERAPSQSVTPALQYPPRRDTQWTSLYKNLKTNLPMRLMAFRAFPHSSSEFLPHIDVLKYLEQFAHSARVVEDIRFNSNVAGVRKINNKWRLTVETPGDANAVHEDDFHHVVVSNGHYLYPRVQHAFRYITNLASFRGQVIHTHNYREPKKMGRVLVVGAGASGLDIASELATIADNTVYLASRTQSLPYQPNNVSVVSGVKSVEAGTTTVVLDDGSLVRDVDVLLLANGYEYYYPFLSDDISSGLVSAQGGIQGLWRHLLFIRDPTIAFLGLPVRIVPFPFMEMQSHLLAATWLANAPLPTADEMQADVDAECAAKGLTEGDRARLDFGGPAQLEFTYCDEIAGHIQAQLGHLNHLEDVLPIQIEQWRRELRAKAPILKKAAIEERSN